MTQERRLTDNQLKFEASIASTGKSRISELYYAAMKHVYLYHPRIINNKDGVLASALTHFKALRKGQRTYLDLK